ncbi:MAG: helix-turn-helix domain-containing protein [Pirellula sp.]
MFKPHDIAATFAKRIDEVRTSKGLSQAELAKEFGTPAAVVGRNERGGSTPSIEVARKIADALDVTLDYMTDPESQLDAVKDQEMLNRLNQLGTLPTEDRTRIIELVDALIRDSKTRSVYTGTKRKNSA